MIVNEISLVIQRIRSKKNTKMKINYNSKKEDNKEKDQREDERNVILKEKRRDNYKLNH